VHSERPSEWLARNGGILELIQLWLNVPAFEKMTDPFYQPLLQKQDKPAIKKDHGKVIIYNFAGEFENTSLPIMVGTPIKEPVASGGQFVMNTVGKLKKGLSRFPEW
jgi:redox-sensitive bicupin YhaK (pirin superfamily)